MNGYKPSQRQSARLSSLVLLALALIAASSAASPAVPITLDQALEIALERNTELERRKNLVALDQVNLDQKRADYYPDLNLSISPSERLGRSLDPASGQIENQRSESLSVRASSSVNLFNGFADQASLEAAQLGLQASRVEYAWSEESIALETVSRFLRIFVEDELVRVEEENVSAQERQLERIRAYWQQGTRARADVLQQEAALAGAELRLLNAQRNRELTVLRLRELLRLDPLEEAEFARLSVADLNLKPVDYQVDELIRDALAQRPELQAQELRIEAAEEQVRAAGAGLWPTLSLSLAAGTEYSSLNQASGLSEQFLDLNPGATVGLSLSIPLFDRERTSSSVERARVQARTEQLALENLEQEVAFEVQQALLDYETARKRLKASLAQKQAAAEALAATEARYDVGAATFVELSQLRAQYVDAAGAWIEAMYEVVLEQLAVEFYRGSDDWQVALQGA